MAASAPYGVENFHTVRDAILVLQFVVSLMRAAAIRQCLWCAGPVACRISRRRARFITLGGGTSPPAAGHTERGIGAARPGTAPPAPCPVCPDCPVPGFTRGG